jgi:hypothetical protein
MRAEVVDRVIELSGLFFPSVFVDHIEWLVTVIMGGELHQRSEL